MNKEKIPYTVIHKGDSYHLSGKTGKHRKTGEEMHEYQHVRRAKSSAGVGVDKRIWSDLKGKLHDEMHESIQETKMNNDDILSAIVSLDKDTLSAAVADAMNAKAIEALGNIESSELEQVDELSRGLLARYTSRASTDRVAIAKNKAKADSNDELLRNAMGGSDDSETRHMLRQARNKNDKNVSKMDDRDANRRTGIRGALKRLAKESLDDYTAEEIQEFMETEEFDQIDELSRKTLASYVGRAVSSRTDMEDNQKKLDKKYNDINSVIRATDDDETKKVLYKAGHKTVDDMTKLDSKHHDRGYSIRGALKRLAKESLDDYSEEEILEFMQTEEYDQLDELSKKTLGNYVKNAGIDMFKKGNEHGTKKAVDDEIDRFTNRHGDLGSFKARDELKAKAKVTSSDIEKLRSKSFMRSKGIDKAVSKLTKESVEQLDEFTRYVNGEHSARVTKKDGEYCVKFFHKGVLNKDAHYYTDDKDDAHGTAKAEVGRLGKQETKGE